MSDDVMGSVAMQEHIEHLNEFMEESIGRLEAAGRAMVDVRQLIVNLDCRLQELEKGYVHGGLTFSFDGGDKLTIPIGDPRYTESEAAAVRRHKNVIPIEALAPGAPFNYDLAMALCRDDTIDLNDVRSIFDAVENAGAMPGPDGHP